MLFLGLHSRLSHLEECRLGAPRGPTTRPERRDYPEGGQGHYPAHRHREHFAKTGRQDNAFAHHKRDEVRMPIYEYQCCKCCEQFERLVFRSDEAVSCPKCESADVQKMMSVCGFKSGGDKG